MRILGKGRRPQELPPSRNDAVALRDMVFPPSQTAGVAEPIRETKTEWEPAAQASVITPSPTERIMGLGQRELGDSVDTCIGQGCHISGNLKFSGTVRIDGHVEGEISAQESIVVGDTAVVEGEITADTITITGKVIGDVCARRRLEIRAPGQLEGNIATPSLMIHDGVRFEGQCKMGRTGDAARTGTQPPLPATGTNGHASTRAEAKL